MKILNHTLIQQRQKGSLTVSFSAGVLQFPQNGERTQKLDLVAKALLVNT